MIREIAGRRPIDVEKVVQRLREHVGVDSVASPRRRPNVPAALSHEAISAALVEIRELLRELENKTQSLSSVANDIGEPTPRRSTARGRAAHRAMQFLGQVFWWYTWRLKQAFGLLSQWFRNHTFLQSRVASLLVDVNTQSFSILQQLQSEVSGVREELLSRSNSTEVEAFRQELASLSARLGIDQKQFTLGTDSLRRELAEIAARLRVDHGSVQQQLEALNSDLLAKHGALHQSLVNEAKAREELHDQILQIIDPIRNRMEDLSRYSIQLRSALTIQEARLSVLLAEARTKLAAGVGTTDSSLFGCRSPGNMDALYVAFEDAFRGSRDEIKEKQRVYLPLLKEYNVGSDERPLLDLGCGRGEFLELLKEDGLRGSGIDANDSMVKICRDLGLDVEHSEGKAYLRGLPDSSLGAVSVFHVVEHLPFEQVLELIDQCLRVLKPGGLLIFETPNPANILVASQNFYMDPTHLKPIPSPMLRFFVEARGFCNVHVRELNPEAEAVCIAERGAVAERFNQAFYGPRDYAVIGSKIASSPQR